MYSIDQRKSLAANYGKKHGLDPVLICAVAHQESSWNPWAIRYEPGFFARYILPMAEKFSDTEARARSFSFGLMQVMGQTAREMGFTGDLASLCDPDVGLDWGCYKLARCMNNHVGDVNAALLEYNGGSDQSYATDVKSHMGLYI